jgi:three-Cys-motif partner protein
LSKSDRAPDKWRLRRNTQIKHDILFEYLKGWSSVFSARTDEGPRVLHYIDSCAGRGWYEEGTQGSPLIAMKVGQQLNEYRQGGVFLECYNVEQDRKNIEDLQYEIDAVRSRYDTVGVRNFFGPFQDHSANILGLIPSEDPAFVFIDPFGYRGIELNEVLRFVERRWNEVFVTFMSDYIGRYMTDPNRISAMDQVFGTQEWQRLAESPTADQRTGAVELYCRQIQERASSRNGQRTYVYPINVAYEDRSSDIYNLIHISHHPKARIVMESAVNRVTRMSNEEKLFIELEVQDLVLETLGKSRRGELTALWVAGAVWLRSLYASWKRDIKSAILDLEGSGRVGVRTFDGRNRTKGGIDERDVIYLKGGR